MQNEANGRPMASVPWGNWFTQAASILQGITESGTTANRPTKGLYVGRRYYDTTLGYPVWYTGSAWAAAGTIGGSTGSTDNRLIRSDGTGGSTIQSTGITVDDSNNVTGVVALSCTSAQIGYATPVTVSDQALTPVVQVHGTSNTTLGVFNWNSGASNPAHVSLMKSKGTSPGSFSVVSSGDILGAFQCQGDDGSEFQVGAVIHGESDGTPGDADMPGRWVAKTTPDGSITPTEAFRVDNAQLTIFQTDRPLRFNNQTSAAGVAAGTLLNAPAAGNPTHWQKINVDGTNLTYPCWPG